MKDRERAPGKKVKLRVKIIIFTLLLTMGSLIICGFTIFFTYLSSTSEQMEKDLTFYLKETSDNLNDKMALLADMMIRIQNNNIMTDYIAGVTPYSYASDNLALIEEQFVKCVDIYSDKNMDENGKPFVSSVYFYPSYRIKDRDVSFCKSYFYVYLLEEEKRMDEEFLAAARGFQQSGRDILFLPSGTGLKLAASLYDEAFKNYGVIVFDLDLGVLDRILNAGNEYRDSFYFLSDNEGRILLENDNEITAQEKESLMGVYRSSVYPYHSSDTVYLTLTRHMPLGFCSNIGIPRNYITIMMNSSLRSYLYLLLIMAPLIFVITFICIYHLTRPLKTVVEKIRLVEQGKLNTKLPDFHSEEFSNISQVFNSMTDRINYLVNDVYEKKVAMQLSELKFLQSQMNPHFMFNVLSAIAIQAKLDGNDKVYEMVHAFSMYTQAKIYGGGSDKILLSKELDNVGFYLYLQKCRFEDKFTYSIEVTDDGLLRLLIPKLSIQPIVENALIHGLEPERRAGQIRIHIYGKEQLLFIEVTDNGAGFGTVLENQPPVEITGPEQEDKSHHIGLINVHRILQLYYGEEYGVRITSVPGKTTVQLRLPYDTGQQ